MNFEIAQKDLDIYVNFHDFKLDPTLKNEGWRLPNLEELKEMYKIHQQGKYNFKDDRYVTKKILRIINFGGSRVKSCLIQMRR